MWAARLTIRGGFCFLKSECFVEKEYDADHKGREADIRHIEGREQNHRYEQYYARELADDILEWSEELP